MSQRKIEFANTLRGIAALLVVISHYLGVYWTTREAVAVYTLQPAPSMEALPTPSLVNWIHFHHWINWGALGVGLFFLISGFVIPYSITGRTRWGFAVGRVFRIWPTYAAGFTLTLLCLYAGSKLAGVPWPYSWQEVVIHYFPGARDHFQTPIIDGIVWTLEVEVQFYIIALILSPLLSKWPQILLLVPVAIAIFTRTYLPVGSLVRHVAYPLDWVLWPFASRGQFLVLMFIGVTLHLRATDAIRAPIAYTAVAVQYALFVILWPSFHTDAGVGAFVSYSAAVPIFVVCMLGQHLFKPHRITTFLADISYPLYVVHAVAGYLLMNGLLTLKSPPMLSIAITFAAAILAATLLHHFIEEPTHRLGKILSRRHAAYRDRIRNQA